MAYGWLITKDHLAEPGKDGDRGTLGPRDVPQHIKDALKAAKSQVTLPRHQFRMYDDDGVLYYTGRAVWDPEDENEPGLFEQALAAPLVNFGTPNAGAVRITWHGHPEWTCEHA